MPARAFERNGKEALAVWSFRRVWESGMPAERAVAIGGSEGAIGMVEELCASLPSEIAAGVCVVIHTARSAGT